MVKKVKKGKKKMNGVKPIENKWKSSVFKGWGTYKTKFLAHVNCAPWIWVIFWIKGGNPWQKLLESIESSMFVSHKASTLGEFYARKEVQKILIKKLFHSVLPKLQWIQISNLKYAILQMTYSLVRIFFLNNNLATFLNIFGYLHVCVTVLFLNHISEAY